MSEKYGKKLVSLEDRLNNIEANHPKKMGNFLMCGFAKKKFEDDLKGIKIIHIGSSEGFSKEDLVLVDQEHTSDSRLQKSKRFIEAFRKIISNQKMIPDNSCVMLSAEQQHLLKSKAVSKMGDSSPVTVSMKKRDQLSKVCF